MMTAYGSVDAAVEAMKQGAYDFVTKPLNLDAVELVLKRALHTRNLETANQELTTRIQADSGLQKLLGTVRRHGTRVLHHPPGGAQQDDGAD